MLSTGDELFSGTGPLPPGKIRDANRRTLLALVRREGWEGIDLGIVGDDESALVELLSSAATTCDAILTSGGVSVGDLDLVRVVLEKLSAGNMRWMQVAIRPAKALRVRSAGRLRYAGVRAPGQPGLGHGQLRAVRASGSSAPGGHHVLHRPSISATTDVDLLRKADGKLHLLRAQLRLEGPGSWHVRTTGGQESHQLHSMSEANSLILLPDGVGAHAGEQVSVLLIDPDRLSSDSSLVLDAPRAQSGPSMTTPGPVRNLGETPSWAPRERGPCYRRPCPSRGPWSTATGGCTTIFVFR